MHRVKTWSCSSWYHLSNKERYSLAHGIFISESLWCKVRKYGTFVMMWKLHLIIISSNDHESESVILHYSLEIWKQCPFKSPDNKSDSSKVHQVHHEGHAALTIRSEDDSRFPWLWIRIGVDSWTFLIGTIVTTPRLSFCLVQQTRPSLPRPAPRAPLASASPRVRGPNLRSSVTTPTLN